MDFRDTLSAGLPAPRDDEPAAVRDDIVDELADHLACAYNRELLHGADAAEARRRVFERFGDPAAVARRLWFDAMRGKIMLQRVLLATCLVCVVVSLASLSLAGAMWIQGNRDRALREAERAEIEALRALALKSAQAQAGQQELVKELRTISEQFQSARSLDWVPVSFQLTEETPDGPPAVGFAVTLSEATGTQTQAMGGGSGGMGGGLGGMGRAAGSAASPHVSDRAGNVDLGLVRPGEYQFSISKSWDGCSATTAGRLVVAPGSRVRMTRVCPRLPLELAPVRVRADWPADLEKEQLVVEVRFTLEPSLGWSFRHTKLGVLPVLFQFVLTGPGTAMTERLDFARPYNWRSEPDARIWQDWPERGFRDLKDPDEALQWERGTYSLSLLRVLRRHPAPEREDLRHFELVVVSFQDMRNVASWTTVPVRDGLPTRDEIVEGPHPRPTARGGTPDGGFRPRAQGSLTKAQLQANLEANGPNQQAAKAEAPQLELPSEFWSRTAAAFEARPAQVNTWTIPLPDELLAAVRESLKRAN
jgi:hypothetical protein